MHDFVNSSYCIRISDKENNTPVFNHISFSINITCATQRFVFLSDLIIIMGFYYRLCTNYKEKKSVYFIWLIVFSESTADRQQVAL